MAELETIATRDVTAAEVAGEALLDVRQLTAEVRSDRRTVRIVDGVDLRLAPGECIALVGESGSGKSVTVSALIRLNKQIMLAGQVVFRGIDLLTLSDKEMRQYRGAAIGIVFQDPLSSLNPRMSIGDQVSETLRIRGVPRRDARRRALETLDELGVDRAAERLGAYPHEFSGGMRQRVVLATALVGEPALLIADEPTTALDVRVQEQVLTVINEIAQRRGLAVILVTHDLGVVAGFADRVAVMYAGRIVEDSPVGHLFSSPQHPYTAKLLRAVPRVDIPLQRLVSIDGSPPSPAARPAGCPFHPRCEFQFARCQTERPELVATETRGVSVACHLVNRSED